MRRSQTIIGPSSIGIHGGLGASIGVPGGVGLGALTDLAILQSLYDGGEAGALYAPWVRSSLYEDSAGTTLASVDGPVGRMEDLSGNGNHATQSVDNAARPVLRYSGGLYWLEFDGVDDYLSIPNATDGVVSSDNTAVFGVRPDDGKSSPYVLGGNGDSGFEMLFPGGFERIRPAAITTGGAIAGDGTTAFTNTAFIYSADWDRSAGAVRGWANQVQEVSVTGTPADKTESTSYALGARGTNQLLAGRIYGGIIADQKLSDADRSSAERALANRSGVQL